MVLLLRRATPLPRPASAGRPSEPLARIRGILEFLLDICQPLIYGTKISGRSARGRKGSETKEAPLMSSNLQPRIASAPVVRRCRISQRMAQAAVQGMRAPAAGMADRIVAKRQIVGHIPAGGNDPMEAPDL